MSEDFIERITKQTELMSFSLSYAQALKSPLETNRNTAINLQTGGILSSFAPHPMENLVVVAGRDILKVFTTGPEPKEIVNLRDDSKSILNLSFNDVVWGGVAASNVIVAASTTGAILVYDWRRSQIYNLERTIKEHTRAVHRLCFHPVDTTVFISASQDGTMKCWDLRTRQKSFRTFDGKSESVRDIQYNPRDMYQFAAVFDNGSLQVWDTRFPNQCHMKWSAHNGLALSIDYDGSGTRLVTGGRDKMIKVWDLTERVRKPSTTIQTIASVSRAKWRPRFDNQIATSSLSNDNRCHLWDIDRPYIPILTWEEHNSSVSDILWRDTNNFWSCSKDQTFVQHTLASGYQPITLLNRSAASFGALGHFAGVLNTQPPPEDISEIQPPISNLPPFIKNENDTRLNNEEELQKSIVSELYSIEANTLAYLAQNYICNPDDVIGTCLHNAKVAISLELEDISVIWEALSILFDKQKQGPSNLYELFMESKNGGLTKGLQEHIPIVPSGSKNVFGTMQHDFAEDSETTSEDNSSEKSFNQQSAEESAVSEDPNISIVHGDEVVQRKKSVDKYFELTTWNPSHFIDNLLTAFLEEGDVQMCSFIALTVQKHIRVDQNMLEQFLSAYVDQLQQFQLSIQATKIIKACNIDSITEMNQNSTYYNMSCASCLTLVTNEAKRTGICIKMVLRAGYLCDRLWTSLYLLNDDVNFPMTDQINSNFSKIKPPTLLVENILVTELPHTSGKSKKTNNFGKQRTRVSVMQSKSLIDNDSSTISQTLEEAVTNAVEAFGSTDMFDNSSSIMNQVLFEYQQNGRVLKSFWNSEISGIGSILQKRVQNEPNATQSSSEADNYLKPKNRNLRNSIHARARSLSVNKTAVEMQQSQPFINHGDIIKIETIEEASIANSKITSNNLPAVGAYKHFKFERNPMSAFIDVPGVFTVDSAPSDVNFGFNPKKEEFQSVGIVARPSSDLKNQSFIEIIPKAITFSNYAPYQVFEKILTVRNLDSISHRYRLQINTPDKNAFFTYEIDSTPAVANGLVAPGLALKYRIMFRPISFGNAKSTIVIISETGELIEVPILASVEQPDLGIGNELNVGYCIETTETLSFHEFTNSGGPARFSIMASHEKREPFQIFEEIGTQNDGIPKWLQFGCFEIFPSYFRLVKGEKITIQVKYKPKSIFNDSAASLVFRVDQHPVRIACDNLTIFEFKLKGIVERPQTQIISVVDIKSQSDYKIIQSDNTLLLDFQKENFQKSKTFRLKIFNPLHTNLPFKWKFSKYGKSIFTINPQTGIMPALGDCEFDLNFLPTSSEHYEDIATLESAVKGLNSSSELMKGKLNTFLSIKLIGEGVQYRPVLDTEFIKMPQGLYVGSSFETRVNVTNYSESDMEILVEWSGFNPACVDLQVSLRSGILLRNSCISIALTLTGYFPCDLVGKIIITTANGIGPTMVIPVVGQIRYKPDSLIFDQTLLDMGLLKLGEIRHTVLKMKNNTGQEIKWTAVLRSKFGTIPNCIFSITPKFGLLQIDETQQFQISFIPLWYQCLRAILQIWAEREPIENSQQTEISSIIAGIDVIAQCMTPRIVVENPKNYIATFVGVFFSWSVMLYNPMSVPAIYKLNSPRNPNIAIEFGTKNGTIQPFGRKEIKIKMQVGSTDIKDWKIYGIVEGMVENGGAFEIQVELEVFNPIFNFRVLENEQAWKNREIIKAVHRKPDTDANLRLDFGSACPIFNSRKRTLIIRNRSSVECNFEISPEFYFSTNQKNNDSNAKKRFGTLKGDQQSPNLLEKQNTTLLLKPTNEPKSGFSSKAGQAFVDGLNDYRAVLERMKRILSTGKGAAFCATPETGIIPAWGEVTVEIDSYNNMVGFYEDFLVCNCGSIVRKIPIRMVVIGSAVKFAGPQLVSNRKAKGSFDFDMLNFGSRTVTQPIVAAKKNINRRRSSMFKTKDTTLNYLHPIKTVTVENHSPREIRLQWAVFIKPKGLDENEDINGYLKKEFRLGTGDVGTIDVSPPVMNIQPFKSAVLQCNFHNEVEGVFDALVIADVEYFDNNGAVHYAPQRIKKPGDKPKQAPILLNMNYQKTYTLNDLISLPKLRIKGKCVKPQLSLEDGTEIKLTLNPYKTDSWVASHFLVNNSDTICDFSIEIIPFGVFQLNPSAQYRLPGNDDNPRYLLKPKQQMMITVVYRDPAIMKEQMTRQREVLEELRRPSYIGDGGKKADPIISVSSPAAMNKAMLFPGRKSPFLENSKPRFMNEELSMVEENPFIDLPPKEAKPPGQLRVTFSNGMKQEMRIVFEKLI